MNTVQTAYVYLIYIDNPKYVHVEYLHTICVCKCSISLIYHSDMDVPQYVEVDIPQTMCVTKYFITHITAI
jgi:hypothetical protein